jgi:ATP-binding cassette subfamily B protein
MATPNSQPPVAAGQVTGHFRLEYVSFAYPAADRPAVTGIDLDVPAGSTLALAGETGSARRP